MPHQSHHVHRPHRRPFRLSDEDRKNIHVVAARGMPVGLGAPVEGDPDESSSDSSSSSDDSNNSKNSKDSDDDKGSNGSQQKTEESKPKATKEASKTEKSTSKPTQTSKAKQVVITTTPESRTTKAAVSKTHTSVSLTTTTDSSSTDATSVLSSSTPSSSLPASSSSLVSPSSGASLHNADNGSNSSSSSDTGLSGGAKAGVAIGVIAGVGLIAALIAFFLLRKKRQRSGQQELVDNEKSLPPVPDEKGPGTGAVGILDNNTSLDPPRLGDIRPGSQFAPFRGRASMTPFATDRSIGEESTPSNEGRVPPIGNGFLGVVKAASAAAADTYGRHSRNLSNVPESEPQSPTENANGDPFRDPQANAADASRHLTENGQRELETEAQESGVRSSAVPAPLTVRNNSTASRESKNSDGYTDGSGSGRGTPEEGSREQQQQQQGDAKESNESQAPPRPLGSNPTQSPTIPTPSPVPAPVAYPAPVATGPKYGPFPPASASLPPRPLMPKPNVHRVLMDFEPSMEDELPLQAGRLVRLLHVYDDGWSLCARMDNAAQGVVPRTCLSDRPLKPRRPNGPPVPPMPAMARPPPPPQAKRMSVNTDVAAPTPPPAGPAPFPAQGHDFPSSMTNRTSLQTQPATEEVASRASSEVQASQLQVPDDGAARSRGPSPVPLEVFPSIPGVMTPGSRTPSTNSVVASYQRPASQLPPEEEGDKEHLQAGAGAGAGAAAAAANEGGEQRLGAVTPDTPRSQVATDSFVTADESPEAKASHASREEVHSP